MKTNPAILSARSSRRNRMNCYQITNELLSKCMGDGGRHKPTNTYITGFQTTKAEGYVLLVHFTQLAMGLTRLPFCQDRIYASTLNKETRQILLEILNQLTQSDIDNVVAEIQGMYRHVQHCLKQEGMRKVRLTRNISLTHRPRGDYYTFELFKYIQAKKLLGHNSVSLELDVLNSFTTSTREYSHLGDIVIETSVDVEDVLYCSNLVSRPNKRVNLFTDELIESNEWVILNRSPNGLVEFPLEDIKLSTRYSSNEKLDIHEAQLIVDSHEPIKLRGDYVPEPRHHLKYGLKPTWRTRLGKWLLDID